MPDLIEAVKRDSMLARTRLLLLPRDPHRLKELAASASLGVATLLAVLKLAAAVVTGSAAILSSLVDSLADITASAITLLAVRIAAQPPDRGHRYGHGKAESLSALGQAALVAGSAVFVLLEATQRLVRPQPLTAETIGLTVMAVAIVLTAGLILLQHYVVRQTGSHAISADSLHYRSDLVTNVGVIASLVAASRYDVLWLDPLVAILVALYLLRGSWQIAHAAIRTLMDHELPAGDRERIKAVVSAHSEVHGLHDLRTREASGTKFIEFHIELDGAMTVRDAHHVTDALEAELAAAYPDAEIIIHQEPEGLQDNRLDYRIHRQVDA